MFVSWQEPLADLAEVHPVQLPGRESRLGETPFRRASAVVDALLFHIAPLLRHKPLVLFGHSVGAKLAYELARVLHRAGEAPQLLFVSGCAAPGVTAPRLPVADLPSPALWAALARLHGTHQAVLEDDGMRALLEPTLRADYAIAETYRPPAVDSFDVPVVALGGLHDPEVPDDDLIAWRSLTRGAFDVERFDGGHFFPATATGALLDRLRVRLAAASATTEASC